MNPGAPGSGSLAFSRDTLWDWKRASTGVRVQRPSDQAYALTHGLAVARGWNSPDLQPQR